VELVTLAFVQTHWNAHIMILNKRLVAV